MSEGMQSKLNRKVSALTMIRIDQNVVRTNRDGKGAGSRTVTRRLQCHAEQREPMSKQLE